DFVVWPETAVVPPIVHHYASRVDTSRFNAVSSVLSLMLRSSSCFVIGNQHLNKEGEDCNAVLVFDPRKSNVLPPEPEIYAKQHLVPFTESLPFNAVLAPLYDRIFPDRSFLWKEGEDSRVFYERSISFSVPICFEDSFGSLCAGFVRNGADCLFCICNDSWACSTVCQRQHLAMSVFRAAENGVPVLRSSASGCTCVIDRWGRLVEELDSFCEGYLAKKVSVPLSRRLSPYTFYGDWFALLELFLLCGLVVRVFIKMLLGILEKKPLKEKVQMG
ncbi:MAG: apolipoprotein N-acyltransferase, partial [Treponema sp.]|nr:apolipoprotein N-acyltransferase [Treponema sp.]